jgi:hypothetical protein
MASSVSRTAPEIAVNTTMLTTLLVVIANTLAAGDGCATALEGLRFGINGIRFAAMGVLKEGVGQARFGCLTLTRSLSRFAADLKPTMTRARPRLLKRSGKPKLTRGHGL